MVYHGDCAFAVERLKRIRQIMKHADIAVGRRCVLQFTLWGDNGMNMKKTAAAGFTMTALALLLTGCGGGGSGGVAGLSFGGKVTDGYIADAIVTLDVNDDLICSPNEPTTLTDGLGNFNFTAAQNLIGGYHMTCASGGTDISSGLPFVGELKAPPGATQITPLTNLVMEKVLVGKTIGQVVAPNTYAAEVIAAEANVTANLGITLPPGVSLSKADPVLLADPLSPSYSPTVLQATAAVQVLMQQTTAAVAAATNAPASQNNTIYQKAAQSLATILSAPPVAPPANPAAAITTTLTTTVVTDTVTATTNTLAPASVAAFVAQAVTAITQTVALAPATVLATSPTVGGVANPATTAQSNVAVANATSGAATLLTTAVANAAPTLDLATIGTTMVTAYTQAAADAAAQAIADAAAAQAAADAAAAQVAANANAANTALATAAQQAATASQNAQQAAQQAASLAISNAVTNANTITTALNTATAGLNVAQASVPILTQATVLAASGLRNVVPFNSIAVNGTNATQAANGLLTATATGGVNTATLKLGLAVPASYVFPNTVDAAFSVFSTTTGDMRRFLIAIRGLTVIPSTAFPGAFTLTVPAGVTAYAYGVNLGGTSFTATLGTAAVSPALASTASATGTAITLDVNKILGSLGAANAGFSNLMNLKGNFAVDAVLGNIPLSASATVAIPFNTISVPVAVGAPVTVTGSKRTVRVTVN